MRRWHFIIAGKGRGARGEVTVLTVGAGQAVCQILQLSDVSLLVPDISAQAPHGPFVECFSYPLPLQNPMYMLD